jgi:hypothetical protein
MWHRQQVVLTTCAPGTRVVGRYASAAAAAEAGASVVNCGVCGRCSNLQDTAIMRARGAKHTGLLTGCALGCVRTTSCRRPSSSSVVVVV